MSDNPLIKAREAALKHNISAAQLQQLTETFQRYDQSGTGKIKMEGVKQMLKDLKTGDDNVEEEAKSLMESLDIDNNGEIELWEFVDHCGEKIGKKHNLLHAESQPDTKRSRPSENED
mmetsp:Transcript_21961/g.28051  ORF Transcript_21961/g.28051 Transcript_21961/m.28051 type:complete len:118 (-) Transcript_21961:89-442(-)